MTTVKIKNIKGYENLIEILGKGLGSEIYNLINESDRLNNLFKTAPVHFLLSNALRCLSSNQLVELRDALIERTPKELFSEAQILKAGEEGEINMIDVRWLIEILKR